MSKSKRQIQAVRRLHRVIDRCADGCIEDKPEEMACADWWWCTECEVTAPCPTLAIIDGDEPT